MRKVGLRREGGVEHRKGANTSCVFSRSEDGSLLINKRCFYFGLLKNKTHKSGPDLLYVVARVELKLCKE